MTHPTASEPITVVGGYPGVFRAGQLDQLVVTSWFAPVSLPAAHELVRATENVIARIGTQRFSTVHLMDRRMRIPESDVRDVVVQLTRDSAPHVACVAVILNGTGFWASAIRSFLTGLRVLAPRSFDIHVHTSVAEVIDWLPAEHAQRTGVTIDAATLQTLLQTGNEWLDGAG